MNFEEIMLMRMGKAIDKNYPFAIITLILLIMVGVICI